MPIVSFVTQKGGSGKSTLAINCAVVAAQAGRRVLILDMDAQRTAEVWASNRQAKTPDVMKIPPSELEKALGVAEEMRFEWVLIDTPGQDSPGTIAAIRVADLCVIPCRPSPADMHAITPTTDAVARLKRPAVVVLTQTPPRSYRIAEAGEALGELLKVSPFNVVSRAVYQDALGAGMGVTEFEPEGKAAEEMRELWKWISQQAKRGTQSGKA